MSVKEDRTSIHGRVVFSDFCEDVLVVHLNEDCVTFNASHTVKLDREDSRILRDKLNLFLGDEK